MNQSTENDIIDVPVEKQPTQEELEALIKKDKELRKEKCIIKINAALQEYNCALVPKMILMDGVAPKSELTILAK